MNESTVTAYLETLLWSEVFHGCGEDGNDPLVIDGCEYESGTPIGQIDGCYVSALAPEIVKEAREDLEGFQSYVIETLGFDPFERFDALQVAHDFCLSRNGHGTGFFERYGVYTFPTVEAPDQVMRLVKKISRTYEGVTDDGATLDVRDALQDAAQTFGTHGLTVWQDEPNGPIHMESHG